MACGVLHLAEKAFEQENVKNALDEEEGGGETK